MTLSRVTLKTVARMSVLQKSASSKACGEAVTLGEKAVELDPGNDNLAIAYAGLLEQDGQYEGALEVLRPMLEREPPVFDAVLTFGQFAPLIGMRDRAITLIEQLQQLNRLTDQQEATFGEALDWLHDQT